jgi:hypothetical protein
MTTICPEPCSNNAGNSAVDGFIGSILKSHLIPFVSWIGPKKLVSIIVLSTRMSVSKALLRELTPKQK